MKETVTRRIRVYGIVQGVGFRYRAEHAANMVGATGWVRNDPDGGVSMEIQGTEEQIDQVILMIEKGTYIEIQQISAKAIPLAENEYGFRTRNY